MQVRLRKPEVALSYCISKLEEKGFLVFQADNIFTEEMRGLSIAYDVFPMISLSRKDEVSARLFTLLYELVHILSQTSGICNDMSQDKAQLAKIELFCNKIVGLALVPTQHIKKNKNIVLSQNFCRRPAEP